MLARAVWITGLLAVSITPAPALADGKIQRARDEASGRGRGHDRDDDHDDDSILGAILCALFSDDDSAPHDPGDGSEASGPSFPSPTYRYAPYPYARGHHGYLVPRDFELALNGDVRPLARGAHDYALQLALEGGYLDDVARAGASVRLLTPLRFEVDTRLDYLHEELRDAAPGEPDSDATTLGATHLAYRLFQGEAGMLRLGGGLRYMVDAKDAHAGVDVLFGADLFVGRPIVLSLELSAGTLGDAVVFAPRAQLGVMLDRWELFAAYEHLMIGDVEFPSPMLGTRLWL